MEKKDIRDFLDDIKRDDESMDVVASMMYGAMKSLEKSSYDDYKKLKRMIMNRDMGNEGYAVSPEDAKMIVSQMRSKSDKGEHWTLNQIEQVGKQHGLKFDEFTVADLYLIMNMYYHDSRSVLGNSVDNYYNMAMSFLQDEDMPESASQKVYDYFCYVVKAIDNEDDEEEDYGNDYRDMNYRNRGKRRMPEYGMDYGDDYDRNYNRTRNDGRMNPYANNQTRMRPQRGTGRY